MTAVHGANVKTGNLAGSTPSADVSQTGRCFSIKTNNLPHFSHRSFQ
jgi:hypothetical protein